jgi:hypothetical protein
LFAAATLPVARDGKISSGYAMSKPTGPLSKPAANQQALVSIFDPFLPQGLGAFAGSVSRFDLGSAWHMQLFGCAFLAFMP